MLGPIASGASIHQQLQKARAAKADLCSRMLAFEVTDRPTAEAALKHAVCLHLVNLVNLAHVGVLTDFAIAALWSRAQAYFMLEGGKLARRR